MATIRTNIVVDSSGAGAPDFPNGLNINGVPLVNGSPGTPGIDGTNGTDGVDGTDGTNGTNGTNGLPGVDGTNGLPGVDGTDGIDGTNGTNGADGAGVPNGGTAGQALTKIDGVDGNTEWTIPASFTHTIVSSTQAIPANTRYLSLIAAPGVTLTLPASPGDGDSVFIADGNSTFGTNAPTIARNGKTIQGAAQDLDLDIDNVTVTLVFHSATNDWRVFI